MMKIGRGIEKGVKIMNSEYCSGCIFWNPDPKTSGEEINTRWGFCRRYPPQFVGMKFQTPSTRGYHWCGEWEEKHTDGTQ
jgi:hypothetical protein